MVFPGDVSSDCCSEISDEDIAKANAKNNLLNESLGFVHKDESDPAMEENEEQEVVENSEGFSEMELEHIALKNDLVNQSLGFGGEDIGLGAEIDKEDESVQENDLTNETEQFFRSSAMELDADDEVSIVIPNDIAAQIRSGGYNIILEPITDGGVGAPISYSIRYIPNTEVHPQYVPNPEQSDKTNNPDMEVENLEENSGDTTESETESSTAKRKGVGSCHRGGKV